MKGILLKDYYLIKSVLYINIVIFVVIGIAMSFVTSTWSLTVLATVMFGMICLTTINTDKTSGWLKVERVLPVSRETVVNSKYILYILLSCIGFVLGMVISIAVSLLKNQFDINMMFIFVGLSFDLALLSGSIAIPCAFLFTEEKSMLSMIIAYPASAAIFAGAAFLLKDIALCSRVLACIGVVLYIVSWCVTRKTIAYRNVA